VDYVSKDLLTACRKPKKGTYTYRWESTQEIDTANSEIETRFWSSLGNGSPLYGADVEGSCFDEGIPWNLMEIDSTLKRGLNTKIMGVTNPYLYVGSWRAMFGWHKEDMDLYSINYLHAGHPKFWYGIDLSDNEKFEDYVIDTFPDDYNECPEFIRHKNTLIQPRNLLQQKIRMKKATQYPGEFVISRAAAYHAGFNSGYNLAEAVNFALPSWIEAGRKAGVCQCQPDSVKIDMDAFEHRLNNPDARDLDTMISHPGAGRMMFRSVTSSHHEDHLRRGKHTKGPYVVMQDDPTVQWSTVKTLQLSDAAN
jgi:hypothetical protein